MRYLIYSLALVLTSFAAQAGTVTARLIRAANESAPADGAVQDIEPKLKKIFGYQHYRQVGKDEKSFPATDKIKLDLGEGFTVFCQPKGLNGDKKREMDVDLYSGKTLLVKQEKLAIRPGKYVLVRGPEVGSTLFIVALTVTE
jgi:hypothetical protein